MACTRCMLVAAAVLLSALPAAWSLQYQHDELLWTKQNWKDYKLGFPWSAALKERDAESMLQLQGPLEGFLSNSMNGPLTDAEEVARLTEQDASRGSGLQRSSLDLTLLDDEASLDAAAGVVQCKVCGVLVKRLWEGLARWVALKRQVPNRKHIAAYAQDLCEYEVTNEVLKSWVLLRARVQQAPGLPFALDGQGHEFYMLSKRAKQHASPPEIQAVRRACRSLLQQDEAAAEKPQVLQQASSLLHRYYQLAAKRLHSTQGAPTDAAAQQLPEAVEAVDDGPKAQRACYDRHPQCQLWRDKGECENNPKYMLGDAGKANGWCMAACGACTPDEQPPLELAEADLEYLKSLEKDLLAVLQTKACLSAAPCKWAAGEGMQQLLASAKAGADSRALEMMEGAEFIGGPVLSKQQQLEMSIDQTRLKESKPMMVRELHDALVQEKQGGGGRSRQRGEVPPPEQLKSEAGAALWEELGGKCLYVSTGWWMYQICYAHHLTQFHMDDKHAIDWVISLGKYEAGSANWTVANASLTGLYPHFTKVPYVSQHYTSGNHCDLDPDEAAGMQRAILRSSELRAMCSPDGDVHVVISEPQQCRYVVELYVPRLCSLPGFQVELPDDLGMRISFAMAKKAGGKGGPPTPGRGASSAQAAAVEVYVLPDTAAEDEDDEYVDPDELEEAGSDSSGSSGKEKKGGRHDEL